MKRLRQTLTMAGACILPLATACGDAPTGDDRGYTKAPLEEPGVFVEPESRTGMDAMGEPDLLIEPGAAEADSAAE